MEVKTESVIGRDLRVGDTILVWWRPGRDTIVRFTDYDGRYKSHPGWDGVRLAEFALLKSGMTVFADEDFERIVGKEDA